MVECGTVTHEQCEKYREKLRGEVQGCIFQEREDRKKTRIDLKKEWRGLRTEWNG